MNLANQVFNGGLYGVYFITHTLFDGVVSLYGLYYITHLHIV